MAPENNKVIVCDTLKMNRQISKERDEKRQV